MDQVDDDLPGAGDCLLCGIEGARFAPPASSCDGSGFAPCLCAGDSCSCHHHGEAYCRGCAACMGEDAPPPERRAPELDGFRARIV